MNVYTQCCRTPSIEQMQDGCIHGSGKELRSLNNLRCGINTCYENTNTQLSLWKFLERFQKPCKGTPSWRDTPNNHLDPVLFIQPLLKTHVQAMLKRALITTIVCQAVTLWGVLWDDSIETWFSAAFHHMLYEGGNWNMHLSFYMSLINLMSWQKDKTIHITFKVS